MAEYINLEKLIALKNNVEYMCYDLYDLEDFIADVKKQCSADVVEVVHSKWIKSNNERKCPICDFFYMTNGTTVYNLCPMCGAKMDGGKNG
jgi:hypothetical protein